jgi:hypothetical protein
MRWARDLTVLSFIGLACGLPVYAHSCSHHRCSGCIPGSDDGCRGCGSHRNTTYGPAPFLRSPQGRAEGIQARLQSLEGRVTEVNYFPGATPDTAMVEVRLAVGAEPVLARLGPAGFLQNSHVPIREGDSVRVTGYWVMSGEGEMLVVTQIALHGRTVRLRDDCGRPTW